MYKLKSLSSLYLSTIRVLLATSFCVSSPWLLQILLVLFVFLAVDSSFYPHFRAVRKSSVRTRQLAVKILFFLEFMVNSLFFICHRLVHRSMYSFVYSAFEIVLIAKTPLHYQERHRGRYFKQFLDSNLTFLQLISRTHVPIVTFSQRVCDVMSFSPCFLAAPALCCVGQFLQFRDVPQNFLNTTKWKKW